MIIFIFCLILNYFQFFHFNLDSEIELFDIIQEMHALPAVPENYDIIIENRVISNLLGLLDHENTDIVVAVINLLFEFGDNEAESENLDKEQLMLQTLIDGQTIKVDLVELIYTIY